MFRFHNHQNLAHYANAAVDIEYKFPFGFKELEGIHSRTDFDLKSHQQYSKRKIQYFDSELNKSYIPYVIETSIGLERMFLAIMCNSYKEEEINDNEKRTVLSIPKFCVISFHSGPPKMNSIILCLKSFISQFDYG